MNISKISSGQNPPEDVNVIIENPMGGEPIKYELDKESGAMFGKLLKRIEKERPFATAPIPEGTLTISSKWKKARGGRRTGMCNKHFESNRPGLSRAVRS